MIAVPVAVEGGLTASLAYARQLLAAVEVMIEGLEKTAASLESRGWSGDAVDGFRSAIVAVRQAKVCIERSRDALVRSLPLRDSFHANPQTGTKDSVMSTNDSTTGGDSAAGAEVWPTEDADVAATAAAARTGNENVPGSATADSTVDDAADPAAEDDGDNEADADMWDLLGGDENEEPITHCLSCDAELDQPTLVDEEGFCRYCRDGAPDFCWTGAPSASGELDMSGGVQPFQRISELAGDIEESKDGRYRRDPGEFEYGECVVKLPGGKQMDAREWIEQPSTQRLLAEILEYHSERVSTTCACGATVSGKVRATAFLGTTVTATGEEECPQCRRKVTLSADVTIAKGLKVFNTVEFTITCGCGTTMPATRVVHGLPGEAEKVVGAGHCDSCGAMASYWGSHVMQGSDPVEKSERINWTGTWRRGLLPEVVDELLWFSDRDDVVGYLRDSGLDADGLGIIAGVLGHPLSGTTLDEHRLGIAAALLPHAS